MVRVRARVRLRVRLRVMRDATNGDGVSPPGSP